MKNVNNPGGKTHLRHVIDACSALGEDFTYADVEQYIRVDMGLRQAPCSKTIQNLMRILNGKGKIEFVKDVEYVSGYRNKRNKIKQYKWVR